MSTHARHPSRARPQGGSVLLISLICLVAVSLMLVEMFRCTVQARERQCLEQRQLQSEWLANAGVARARLQTGRNPDYRGETWEISASELESADAQPVTARVVIEIFSEPDRPRESSAPAWRVTAEYPLQEHLRVRTTK